MALSPPNGPSLSLDTGCVDEATLWEVLRNPLHAAEVKSAAWYRLEGVLWYNAHVERGLPIAHLPKDEYAAAYEVLCLKRSGG